MGDQVLANQPPTTRRALFGAALIVPALAIPAIASDSDGAWWRTTERDADWLADDGALVVRRARLEGMRPDDYSGIYVSGRGYEAKRATLIFGDWHVRGAKVYYVTADAVRRWVSV